MKSTAKTALFFLVLGIIAFYSKSISAEVLNNYNNCVDFMANNTVGNSPILGI